MSSMHNEVLELKNKIIECQDETLQLWNENQCLRERCDLVEQAKQRAQTELTRHVRRSSTQTLNSAKELEDLSKSLKCAERTESVLKELYDKRRDRDAEYKKTKEMKLIDMERTLDRSYGSG